MIKTLCEENNRLWNAWKNTPTTAFSTSDRKTTNPPKDPQNKPDVRVNLPSTRPWPIFSPGRKWVQQTFSKKILASSRRTRPPQNQSKGSSAQPMVS